MSNYDALAEVRATWEHRGKTDPLWAILSEPDKQGNQWDLQQFMSTGEGEIAELFTRLSQLGLTPPSRRALDFGCGEGRLSHAPAGRFKRVDGVDISESMVKLVQRFNRTDGGCTFHHNPASDIRLLTEDGLAVLQLPSHFESPVLRLRRRPGAATPRRHRLYRKIRHRGEPPPVPPYPMYWIHSRVVRDHIRTSGGATVAVDRDHSAPPEWVSFQYYVRPGRAG